MLSRPVTEQSKFRTECWLERSLFEKRLCAVEENMTYAPIVIRSPPEGELPLI
jgi:DNA replication regulator DPB11